MSIAEKLQTIATNEQKVFEAGKRAEYDAFWDAFQDHGNRSNYMYAFCGSGWFSETLAPKYVCTPTNGMNMFFLCGYQSKQPTIDFRTIADKFDLSKVTNGTNIFYSAAIDHISADFSSATTLSSAFDCGYTSRFTTVNLKVTPVTVNVSNMFAYAGNLKNLSFTEDSEIACGGLNLKDCQWLTGESIRSVIRALSASTSGLSVTFSQTAVNNAFTPEEWTALSATKPNWEIVLI